MAEGGTSDLSDDVLRRVSAPSAFVCGFLVLLAIGVLAGEVIGIPLRFSHFVVAIASGVLTVGFALRRVRRLQDAVPLAAAVLAWVGLVVISDPSTRVALLLAWAGACASLFQDVSPRWLRGALLAGFILILLRIVPGIGLLADQLSAAFSARIGAGWGGARLGATASGLALWGALLAFVLGTGLGGRRRTAVWVVALTGAALVHTIVQGVLVSPIARALVKDLYVLFAAAAVALAGGGARVPLRTPSRSVRVAAVSASVVSIPILLALLWLPVSRLGSGAGERNVLLYDHDMLASWETPADRAPGTAFTGAMFGLLPAYLSAFGHTCRVSGELNEETLAAEDLVILANPGRAFSPEERGLLLGFVHEGGALLVLADHTDIGGMKGFLDELLEPTGLRLRFDSAVSISRDWRRALRVSYPLSTAFGNLDVPVSIGASVYASLGTTNVPLLVGTDAYSDRGNRENDDNAMLGNLAYDRGEAYGGILLAVATSFGRGKVALFGDTSPFQNGSLATSYAYTDALVRWLASGGSPWREPVVLVLAVLFAGALACAVCTTSGSRTLLVLCVFLAAALAGGEYAASSRVGVRAPTKATLGVIDLSRTNRLSIRALVAEGVDALSIGLSRAGYLSVIDRRGSVARSLRAGDLLVEVGATASISRDEAERLVGDLERGVDLLVGTDWPVASPAEELFLRLGIGVANVPLGGAHPSVAGLATKPELTSAWPLVLSDEWTCLAEIELEGATFCVAAERPVGGGRAIVVGDVGIFTNAPLEGKGHYYAENVALLEFLLERMRAP